MGMEVIGESIQPDQDASTRVKIFLFNHPLSICLHGVILCVNSVGSRYVEEVNDRAPSGCPDPDVTQ